MTKLFDYEYLFIINVGNYCKKFAGEGKPIKSTRNWSFSSIIGFRGVSNRILKSVIMYSFLHYGHQPSNFCFILIRNQDQILSITIFFSKTESIKSIQECPTMSKGCSSDSKHTSVWFSMRYLLFNVKAHKGQTAADNSN